MEFSSNKETIVVSGTNMTDGGIATILHDCLEELNDTWAEKYNILALVGNDDFISKFPNIKFIEYPKSKKSWFYRVWYEYFGFRKVSMQYKPKLWLSLYDTTPNVKADIKAVYCHNPGAWFSPNYPKDILLAPKVVLFSLFYIYLYKININKNNYLIAQQNWMIDELSKIASHPQYLIARPNHSYSIDENLVNSTKDQPSEKVFFFPSYPRGVHKNFDVLLKACQILEEEMQNGDASQFKLILTIDGTENGYTNKLVEKYKHLNSVEFIGLIPRKKVEELYVKADCLLFPSKLETWGLPLSEFKLYGKPIIASNLPYAKETIGEYSKVKFFNPDDAIELASNMKALISDTPLEFDETSAPEKKEDRLYIETWTQLVERLLS